MHKELYIKAAQCCLEVYEDNIDLGTTEYQHRLIYVDGKHYQAIVIAGTNEFADNWRNVNLWSKKGIKLGSYNEATEVMNAIKLFPHIPIVVTGHSKGGAAAVAFFLLFCNPKKDWCIVFNPARCLRYWRRRKISHVVMFIDPDDMVSEILGFISFGLPVCETYEATEDHFLYDFTFEDHGMKKMVEFTKNMTANSKDTK